jgi:hypothetical protein
MLHMSPLPSLTPEERAAALQRATKVREERYEPRAAIRRGEITLQQVRSRVEDLTIGGMKVGDVLTAVLRSRVRANSTLERLGISRKEQLHKLQPEH